VACQIHGRSNRTHRPHGSCPASNLASSAALQRYTVTAASLHLTPSSFSCYFPLALASTFTTLGSTVQNVSPRSVTVAERMLELLDFDGIKKQNIQQWVFPRGHPPEY